MNKTYIIICGIALLLFSSFKTNMECEYAGSNIGFAKTQTELAIAKDDINKARYHAYKALNAIVKSQNQLAICGCKYAGVEMEEVLRTLKLATKATSLSATKVLLERSLQNTIEGLESLETHETHQSKYDNEVLVLNTLNTKSKATILKEQGVNTLNDKIDLSLKKYEQSLKLVVESVDCKAAKAFAQNIFDHCEKELLKPDLSEGKKYYNLRTKEITADALLRIPDCL
jgi:hypothetical protein